MKYLILILLLSSNCLASWKYEEEIDKMTDKTKKYLTVWSKEVVDRNEKAELTIGKDGKNYYITISSPYAFDYSTSGRQCVDIRIDNKKQKKECFALSSDNHRLNSFSHNGEYQKLKKSIESGDKIMISYHGLMGQIKIIEFDTSGLKSAFNEKMK